MSLQQWLRAMWRSLIAATVLTVCHWAWTRYLTGNIDGASIADVWYWSMAGAMMSNIWWPAEDE